MKMHNTIDAFSMQKKIGRQSIGPEVRPKVPKQLVNTERRSISNAAKIGAVAIRARSQLKQAPPPPFVDGIYTQQQDTTAVSNRALNTKLNNYLSAVSSTLEAQRNGLQTNQPASSTRKGNNFSPVAISNHVIILLSLNDVLQKRSETVVSNQTSNGLKRQRPESNVKPADHKHFNAYATQQYLASAISGPLT